MNSPTLNQRIPRVLFSVLVGAMMSIMGAFPAAFLIALFYRFPIPVVGWVSGPELIASQGLDQFVYKLPGLMAGILISVFVYGILGGYIVLATLGAIGGWITHPSGAFNYREVFRSNLKIAVVVDFLYALVLANLDRFIKF